MGHSENTSRENLTRLLMQSPVILYSVPAGSPGAANPTPSGSEWNDQTGPLQTGGTSQLGIAPATTRTYRTGVMCYKSFCQRLSLEVTPALEEELLLFVTELTQSRAVSTIRCYLAVVRHFHKYYRYQLCQSPGREATPAIKGIQRIKPTTWDTSHH